MTEVKSVGISKTVFIVGLVAAILVSSLISVLAITQLPMVKGPKGDKGDTGETGPQGGAGQNAYVQSAYQLTEREVSYSPNWADVPGISAPVRANVSSRIAVTFSFDAYNTLASQWVQVQAVIDDTTVLSPGYVTTAVSQNLYSVYSYSWAYESISVGIMHYVKIQFRISGGTCYISYPTMNVLVMPQPA